MSPVGKIGSQQQQHDQETTSNEVLSEPEAAARAAGGGTPAMLTPTQRKRKTKINEPIGGIMTHS